MTIDNARVCIQRTISYFDELDQSIIDETDEKKKEQLIKEVDARKKAIVIMFDNGRMDNIIKVELLSDIVIITCRNQFPHSGIQSKYKAIASLDTLHSIYGLPDYIDHIVAGF